MSDVESPMHTVDSLVDQYKGQLPDGFEEKLRRIIRFEAKFAAPAIRDEMSAVARQASRLTLESFHQSSPQPQPDVWDGNCRRFPIKLRTPGEDMQRLLELGPMGIVDAFQSASCTRSLPKNMNFVSPWSGVIAAKVFKDGFTELEVNSAESAKAIRLDSRRIPDILNLSAACYVLPERFHFRGSDLNLQSFNRRGEFLVRPRSCLPNQAAVLARSRLKRAGSRSPAMRCGEEGGGMARPSQPSGKVSPRAQYEEEEGRIQVIESHIATCGADTVSPAGGSPGQRPAMWRTTPPTEVTSAA